MSPNNTQSKKGESLIELVLAMAIFAAILPTVLFAIGSVNQSEPQRNNYFNSTLITEETKNIVQQIKNNNWNDLPANGEYVLTGSGTVWTWTNVTSYGVGTPIPTTRDGLTRTVTIADALRTAGGALTDVVSGSIVDSATKKITINTTWSGAAAPASSVVYMSRNNAIQTVTFTTLGDFQAGGQVTNGTVLNTPTPGDDGSITTTNANPAKASSLVSWWSMNAYNTNPETGISWIDDSKVGGNNTAIVYPLTLSGTPAPTLVDSRFGKSIQLNITGVPVPPAGWYKLDETSGTSASNTVDGSNPGTLTNSPTWVASKYGNGVSFDGTDDYISLSYLAADNLAAGTIAMWVKFPNVTASQSFFSKQHDGINSFLIFETSASSLLQFKVSNDAGYTTGATTILTNTWYHVAATWNGSTQKIYINGVQDGTVNTAQTLPSDTSDISVGAWTGGGNNYGEVYIDDLRIYNYARDASQLVVDSNGTSTLLDENNLSHLRVTNNIDLGASNAPFSWEYMVKPTGTTTKPVIAWGALGTTPTPTTGANGWIMGSGTDIFTDLKPPSGSAQYTNESQITNAKFNHVVMTYNGSTISHYLNGTLVNTSSSVSTPPSTALPLSVGFHYPSSYFIGEIDDVATYNTALTAQEVHDSFYSSFTSAVKDFGNGQSPQMLSLYAEATKPTDTDVQIRVASRNAYTDGSDICPTSESEYTFVGPAGTTGADDYFTIGTDSSGVVATGGTITDVDGYRIHTFTSSGTFTVTQGGNVETLVVAGGGGGGSRHGGGGGAGGLQYSSSSAVTAQGYSIVVGNGGDGGTYGLNSPSGAGYAGEDSSFNSIVAIGGGGGCTYDGCPAAGGSGGGGAGANSRTGASGTGGQGNNGGTGGTNGSGAGGGGAGAVGADSDGVNGSDAGVGLAYTISGSSVYYAGGGGGGSDGGYVGGSGGNGGGGHGGNGGNTSGMTAGAANTGGGGGATRSLDGYSSGAAGGSGIVIIRYRLPTQLSNIIYSGTTGNYVNPGRCLRYKVYFKSLNAFPSGSQPTFNSIRFTYAL